MAHFSFSDLQVTVNEIPSISEVRLNVSWAYPLVLQNFLIGFSVILDYLGPCENAQIPPPFNFRPPFERNYVVSGLEKFSLYNVTVRAASVLAGGVRGTSTTATTSQGLAST